MNIYIKSFLLVLIAGIIWSFGIVTVRYMVDADQYIFQYLAYRGLATTFVIILFLIFFEGFNFYKNLIKINFQSIIGSFFLAITFTCFIFSITKTSVAVTLLMLAAIPFITGALAYFILGEVVRRTTLIAMIIALIGICLLIINDYITGSIIGAIIGLMAAIGFSLYTISIRTIRLKTETAKFFVVAVAGLICSLFALTMLEFSLESITKIPVLNIILSLVHGIIVASGFILYSMGSKHLPSADLTFLTLLEVVGGIIWAWIPIFGINETPNLSILTGGSIIIFAIIFYGFNLKKL